MARDRRGGGAPPPRRGAAEPGPPRLVAGGVWGRGGVAAAGDAVAVGAASDDLHLAVLERASGAVRWRHAGRDFAGVTATPVLSAESVLAARAPGWLAAYDLRDGSTRWEQPLDDAW